MVLFSERAGSGPRLVLVHGFTQTRRCWGAAAAALAADHEVLLVDAPGHGRSADVRADLTTGGHELGEAGGAATYVGYSMGGRFCLHLALAEPALVHGLVLLGATAGLEDEAARSARVEADRALAARLRHDGLDAFLDHWLAQTIFATLPPNAQLRGERAQNTVEGLATSLELAGTGTQEPLWHELERLAMPVLVVAGADDAKFAALAERLAEVIGPNATLAIVDGAGHAVHLEEPERFVAMVQLWLAAHGL